MWKTFQFKLRFRDSSHRSKPAKVDINLAQNTLPRLHGRVGLKHNLSYTLVLDLKYVSLWVT